ncbi:MAG: T9SS type A sorting domain-containing protein [Salinivirgaceae bacterium]|nr:T9SS type A sorting domain-containing protein [Salinivirgaceae bacterium]
MKKILILSFILFLGVLIYAQDTVYSEPTSYTGTSYVDADGANWTLGGDWVRQYAGKVIGDANQNQNELLLSPTIDSVVPMNPAAGDDITVSFKYYSSQTDANSKLYVLFDDRDPSSGNREWDTQGTATQIAWSDPAAVGGQPGWNPVSFQISTNGAGIFSVDNSDTLQLAFVVDSAGNAIGTGSNNIWMIDDIVVSVDTNTNHLGTPLDDADTVIMSRNFQNGTLLSGNWLTSSPTISTQSWSLNTQSGVLPSSPVSNKLGTLTSEPILIPDNALGDMTLRYDFWYTMNGIAADHNIFIIDNATGLGIDSTGGKYENAVLGVAEPLTPPTNGAEAWFVETRLVDLAAYKGTEIVIKFQQETTTGSSEDFFIDSIKIDQAFDHTSIVADASITVTPANGEVLAWPTNDYEGDFKEGFWQVAPENWTKTSSTGAFWKRETTNGPNTDVSPANHDYYAYIDTVGANGIAINESMQSELIGLDVPSQGADYEFSFEWATEAHLNAGEDTNPLFGPSAKYNFASISIMYRLDGGNWDTIWTEADEVLLEVTTLTTGDAGFNATYNADWPGWTAYLDAANANSWYKTVLPITIPTTSSDIEFRINYKASNAAEAGAFMIDNMYLLETELLEFEVEAMTSQSVTDDYVIDYYTIPISQIENPVELSLVVTNNGVTGFTDNPIVASVTDNAVTRVYGVETVSASNWTAPYPATERIVINDDLTDYYDNLGGLNLEAGHTYKYSYTATLNGTGYPDDKTFVVGTDLYRKHDGTDDGNLILSDDSTGAVGSIFEFKRADVVNEVKFYVDAFTAGSEAYMSIIKLKNATDTKGEKVVYTSPRELLTNTLTFDNKSVTLDTGFYAFMLHQTDKNPITLSTSTTFEGEIVRGGVDSLYSWDAENYNIRVDVGIKANVNPTVDTEFPNNKYVVEAGDSSINIMLLASDENGNPLTWVTDKAEILDPVWLGDWMDITSSGDTLFIKGVPKDSDLGKVEVTATVQDDRNGEGAYTFTVEVVSDLAYFEPYYDADFRLFTQQDDVMDGSGNSPISWTRNQNDAGVNATAVYSQYEILLSPPIMLPADSKAVGVEYSLIFDWKVGSFDHFCKGTDVLGSKDAVSGGNYADVTLEIFNGTTWTKLWKEDDPELVANSTSSVQAGALWAYDNSTHTSKIDVSAYAGSLVYFRFVYESKNAVVTSNDFDIYSFEVEANQEIDLTTFFRPKYFNVPGQVVDTAKGIDVEYYIVNKGQRIPEGSTYDIEMPELGIFKTYALTEAMFSASDSVVDTFNFIPNLGSYQGYDFTIRLNVDDLTLSAPGQDNMTKTINVTNNVLGVNEFTAGNRSGGISIQTVDVGNGLGMKFTLDKPDVLEAVSLSFFDDLGNGKEKYSITVVKLDSATAVTGKPVATIDDNATVALTTTVTPYPAFGNNPYQTIKPKEDNDIGVDLALEAGCYVLLVNQLEDNKPIEITTARQAYDPAGFVRGNEKGFYNEPGDKFFLDIALEMQTNVAPVFSSVDPGSVTVIGTNNDEVVYQGETFERLIVARDANVWGYTTISEVSLPYWMTLTQTDDGIATLSGNTADANPGTYEVVLNATDGWADSDGSFIVTVKKNQPPVFGSTPVTQAFEGTPYSYTATAYDLLGEVVEITVDSMPSWMQASAVNDTVMLTNSSSPTIGLNWVKLTAKDPQGNVARQTFEILVYANEVPVFVTKPSVDPVKVGLMYEYAIVASDENGNKGLVISADTTEGSWLKFVNSGNGRAILSGEADVVGVDTITLTVTDPALVSVTQQVIITKVSNLAPVFTNDTVFDATEDVNYVQPLTVFDAENNSLYFQIIKLPNWLTFSVTGNDNALIQGVPLQSSGGDVDVSILVGDGNNTEVFEYTINLTLENDVPVIITENIDDAFVGEEYNAVIEAWDEEGAALTFNADLPTWLTLVEDGNTAKLSGTPSMDDLGAEQVSVSVSDGNSFKDQIFNLSVAGATSLSEDMMRVELYPNPTNGSFSLKNAEGANVTVISNSGQVVKQVDKAQALELIDISNLDAGTYFIRIVSQDKVLTKSLSLIK